MPFLFAVFSPIKHPSNLTTAEGNRSILAAGFGERTAPSSLQQALQQFLFSFFSHSDFVPTDIDVNWMEEKLGSTSVCCWLPKTTRKFPVVNFFLSAKLQI